MDAIPQIATARLVLRGFRAGDLDAYAAMCADPEVMRHIGKGGPAGRDVAWGQLAFFLGHWSLCGYGMWAIEHDGRLIGRAGFIDPEGWPGLELGWLLARDAWGQGYATEACVAALRHGREQFGTREIISLIRPANQRSIAVASRLGATLGREIDFMGAPAQVYVHAADA
ncbi:MAG TPA: GNAT family N-acetyltransferase [Burkholderiaceae bacterium]|nr:GNAT family N-acetyltransferase [Burkholderiaceae bacterium]